MRKFTYIVVLVLVCLLFGGYYFSSHNGSLINTYKTQQESDVYVRFGMEAYDSIHQNYWAQEDKYDLPNLFKLSLEKTSGEKLTLASSTRYATADMLLSAINSTTSPEAKKNIILNTLMVVLYNLEPAGRNGLLEAKEETALRKNVSNINPEKDLYKDLGLQKGASESDINKAYEKQYKELKNSTSTEAKSEIEKITYAKKVLTSTDSKSLYDQNQIEPTVFSQKLGKTLYLYVSKISPTTFLEFAKAVDNARATPSLNSMIIDVRGNIGGSLDFVQNFMGLFVGQNQYAFDLFHQGKYDTQRTVQPKFPELARFGEIAIITDEMTQSTAEVISSTFKKFHLGKTVGKTTRGWGTVENTYPLNTVIDSSTKYTLLLVNSITLRDDGEPIEGRGVDPDVKTSDPNWNKSLISNFHTQSLIDALLSVAIKAPLK